MCYVFKETADLLGSSCKCRFFYIEKRKQSPLVEENVLHFLQITVTAVFVCVVCQVPPDFKSFSLLEHFHQCLRGKMCSDSCYRLRTFSPLQHIAHICFYKDFSAVTRGKYSLTNWLIDHCQWRTMGVQSELIF